MKKFVSDFKEFISKGNVLDMAVGVIIGGAFGKIVTSLVNDIIMPLVGILIGGHDFSNLVLKVGDAKIYYGSFIQNIVDFLIVAFSIFVFIKIVNNLKNKTRKKVEEKTQEPATIKSDELKVLEEIRDLLKKEKKKSKKKQN